VLDAFEADRVTTMTWTDKKTGALCEIAFVHQVPLNEANQDLLVHFLQYSEYSDGHRRKHLSVVFAMLMMLAFLVDQTQQLCCPLFRAVWKKFRSKRALWEKLRSHFDHFVFQSVQHLYEVMLHDLAKELPAPTPDTS